MKKIKSAKYLAILPAGNDNYCCLNIVTNNYVLINEKTLSLIQYLSSWKSYSQAKERFKLDFDVHEFSHSINNLIIKNILISESNINADRFKEDIIIVGLGAEFSFNCLSLEAYTTLRNCSKVVYVCDNSVLNKINSNLVNLNYLLTSKKVLFNGFLSVAQKFIEIASKEKDVVYATEGNPFVGEAIPTLICEIAKEKKLSVKVISGQSSLDLFFINSHIDPFNNLVITSPSHLEKALLSDMPIVLVLVGYQKYGGIAHLRENFNSLLKEELLDIKTMLLKKFPPSHKIYMLNLNGSKSLPLKKIEDFSITWQARKSTLYIPPK